MSSRGCLLILISLISHCNVHAQPTELRIGALIPMFRTQLQEYVKDDGGIRRLNALIMALSEINNKTDGVHDELLPNTTLKFAYRDSKRDEGVAFLNAFSLITDTFCDANSLNCEGVHVLIGAASSSPSKNAQVVAKQFATPQISYSSTSPELSDNSVFPYFLRVVPPDDFSSLKLTAVLQALNWTCVTVVRGSDAYGTAGAEAFIEAITAGGVGVEIAATINVVKDSQNMVEPVNRIIESKCPVVMVWTQIDDAARLATEAYHRGYYGGKYQWIFPDIAIGKQDVFAGRGLTHVEAAAFLKGSLAASFDFGVGTPAHKLVNERWVARTSTKGTAPGNCYPGTDDDTHHPTPVYQQDHDDNANTPTECAGIDHTEVHFEAYATYAYDAVYAAAWGLHKLAYEQSRFPCPHGTYIDPRKKHESSLCFTGEDLLHAILSIQFDGVTGRVKFAENGDRSPSGLLFLLYQHGGTLTAQNNVDNWQWVGNIGNEVDPSKIIPCSEVEVDGRDCVDVIWNEGATTGFAHSPQFSFFVDAVKEEDQSSIPFWIWIILGGVILLIVPILCYLLYNKIHGDRVRKRLRAMVPLGEVALVFTDIQDSTRLWDLYGEDFAESLEIHNQIIRRIITRHNGWEVKTQGDSFMVAFKTLADAIKFSLSTQTELLNATWPISIIGDATCAPVYSRKPSRLMTTVDSAGTSVTTLTAESIGSQPDINARDPDMEDSDDGCGLMWCGLRVRMGVHIGEPNVEFDVRNAKVDYLGPMVNKTARVEGRAMGGQICITEEVYNRLQHDTNLPEYALHEMGPQVLRGFAEACKLWYILPQCLAGRTFVAAKLLQCDRCQMDLFCPKCDGQRTNGITRGQRVALRGIIPSSPSTGMTNLIKRSGSFVFRSSGSQELHQASPQVPRYNTGAVVPLPMERPGITLSTPND